LVKKTHTECMEIVLFAGKMGVIQQSRGPGLQKQGPYIMVTAEVVIGSQLTEEKGVILKVVHLGVGIKTVHVFIDLIVVLVEKVL